MLTAGRLPAAPLVDMVAARGGLTACGVAQHSAEEAAFYRARRDGYLTERAAEALSVRVLGVSPWSLWGDALLETPRKVP